MATISLLSGNYWRKNGEAISSGYNRATPHCSNELLRNANVIRWMCFKSSKQVNTKRLRVFVRIGKGKKHDYPWSDGVDPNSKAPLTYLSYFKPLKEKPKPVTLAFEKPLVDLEQKIIEVQRMADDTGLDFTDQINALEMKYEQALKDLYARLTPIQRLSIARHPNRPTVLDHIINITDKWVELHGDRAGYDDPAIVTGIGSIEGRSYMFIGHQKGRNTKENIMRNFGMPTPHGYRKALRMMKYADHHGFPIVTFVDTPGAFADLKSEELGQGEAIAQNLRTMFGLKVPIITIVTGEGGSGGALAIACPNKLLMLENSAFYVASPEACAAILWKSSQAAPKAAEKLRITAQEHYKLKIADGIIPEPLGGAHADPVWTSMRIKDAILQQMEELTKMNTDELLKHRMLKFRSIGNTGFKEGSEIEPIRKRNMKTSELNTPRFSDIESEIEDLKKTILKSKGPPYPVTEQKLKKLEEDLDAEMTKAFVSMGLVDRIESLNLELARAHNPDQALNKGLKEKADKIIQEFKRNLSQPGAYIGLKQKLQMRDIVAKLLKMKEKREKLETELNQKLSAEIKSNMEKHLKIAKEKLLKVDPIDDNLAKEVEDVKGKLEEVLKSANLQVVGRAKRENLNVPDEVMEEIMAVNGEIKKEIERVIEEKELGWKIDEMKAEAERDPTSEKSKKLEAEIKGVIADALSDSQLKERLEKLRVESEEVVVGADNGSW